MHIGGVVDQVAQPDNILLLQNLGLNAAVRKISAEQLELLKQIALNAIAYPSAILRFGVYTGCCEAN